MDEFIFTTKVQNDLAEYINDNHTLIAHQLITNIVQYVAAQDLNFHDTVDALMMLLEGDAEGGDIRPQEIMEGLVEGNIVCLTTNFR